MKKTFLSFFFIGLSFLFFYCNGSIPEFFGGPVEQAMGLKKCDLEKAFSRSSWNILREIYNWHIVDNLFYCKDPLIPKIIHHIWLGSPFPEKYKILRETWQKYHPDWTFILWTDEDIENFCLENKDLYDESSNYGVKSDIARYEILYRIGGLYVDTDFECVKSFDVFHHCCDFYAGAAPWERVLIYNGLIGSAPGHPVIRYCIDNLCSSGGKKESGAEIDYRTGPYFFSLCFFSALRKCKGPSVIFPAAYFYPWPHYQRHKDSRTEIVSWVRPETFGIHHWHVSWMKEN